ncbi:peptide ABC transporter substrate-binding protein [Corynebacterium minutissimum]|uniref:Iron ABC transporter substrate-binding protein n=1 Tax=Corynebacterium minutissimum TaxID=38301 RepID=A0A376CSE8_9CORY|nr:ABC transporter substrate-binding protein [Corynebacterium minutissimum]QRP59948.1 ABC transporter substrate-binding protein [Corynebacterium minutissimum]STC74016.1 iron ABC transporter substrate-binding protein [Corynebacterium minutissimum]
MTLKKTLAVVSVATLPLTLAACGGDNSGSTAASGSGDGIIVVNGSEPQNPLIPANTNEVGGGRIVDSLYSGLVYYDGDGEAQNELAESIEPNDDNTEFTVKLKESTFSDGSPVTANNFVDAWNYAVANDQLNASFFSNIKGFKEGVEKLEGLKVVDDLTFTIALNSPEQNFPAQLGYSAFYPLHESAYDDMDAYGQNPITNGPYKLSEWNHNQDATVVPNEEYKGGQTPQNDGIKKFVFYASQDAAYSDLLAGNLDVLDAIPDAAFDVYETDLGERAVNQPTAVFQSFTLGENLEHFSGEEGALRRQAISHAINREEITETIFKGTRTPAKDFTSPVLPGYSEGIKGNEVLEYDPEKAKKLWAEADKIKKWDNPSVEIAYNSDGGHKSWVDATTNSIKNALGIEAVGAPYPDFKSLRDEVTNRTIKTAFRTGWQADYPSQGNFLAPLYRTGGSSNDGDYANSDFDKALDEALTAHSDDEANKKYIEAQEVLFKDLPAIPLWYANATGGYSENVDNVVFSWKSQPVYYNITKK